MHKSVHLEINISQACKLQSAKKSDIRSTFTISLSVTLPFAIYSDSFQNLMAFLSIVTSYVFHLVWNVHEFLHLKINICKCLKHIPYSLQRSPLVGERNPIVRIHYASRYNERTTIINEFLVYYKSSSSLIILNALPR